MEEAKKVKAVWLTFDFGDQKALYNMKADVVEGVCDDLATDLTETVPLYWFNHQKKQFIPISIYTDIEME